MQPFSFIEKRKTFNAINVLGLIKGAAFPEKYIVISAHYDHEGVNQGEIYNGADDNASGLSPLFSFAEYFKKYPPKHSVILAAFDDEELELQGSEFFVNHSIIPLKDIVLNMNIISRSDKKELYVVGNSKNKKLKTLITNSKYSFKLKLVRGHDGYDDYENIHPEFYIEAVKTIISVFQEIDASQL